MYDVQYVVDPDALVYVSRNLDKWTEDRLSETGGS